MAKDTRRTVIDADWARAAQAEYVAKDIRRTVIDADWDRQQQMESGLRGRRISARSKG